MLTQVDIHLALDKAQKDAQCRKAVAQQLGVSPSRIQGLRLLKESIDARRRPICKQLRFLAALDECLPALEPLSKHYPVLPANANQAIIVGCGPAGLFAAIQCIKLGMKPILLERGKKVLERQLDLEVLNAQGELQPESNYCFGEGGAGTFSDGKLFTRSTKRGPIRDVYECFVAHGAPLNILTDAHPHIGSDKLPHVIASMRESIIEAGGELHFNTRVTGIIRSSDGKRACGVSCAEGQEFLGEGVILATGHSARDIYQMLHDEGLLLEAKGFAVGVRIEHPQSLIDKAQYHLRDGQVKPAALPAASYTLATKIRERGVHSFCMCPGGHIVPAATADDEVVVNGMSLSKRDSAFANSGFVVGVHPEDTAAFAPEHGVLAGLAYQRALEVATSQAGGGRMVAPAQRVIDFIANKLSDTLPETSYRPGLRSWDLRELLPQGVSTRMMEGLQFFNTKLRGYAGEDALLIGCETRTSAAVRIPREKESLQHPQLQGLYPCAEGAGYAGGIVSAAVDGMRCASHLGTSN